MLDRDSNSIEVKGFQPAWRYADFDATQICELVAQCIDQALDEGLPSELSWLRAYDKAMGLIGQWLDGEQTQLSLLIRYIVQNEGRLSKSKCSLFERYTDDEIAKTEEIAAEAFTVDNALWQGGQARRLNAAESRTSIGLEPVCGDANAALRVAS